MTVNLAIDVQKLWKHYREGVFVRKSFAALQGIDLQVPRGEVFGLLGPNGAGKTTLIKILLGIVRGSGGKAFLLGDPAGSRTARRRIGYLPENLSFPPHHTAVRAMQFYGRLSQVPERVIKRRTGELLELVGLSGREKELVRKYSKGMRQRLGLAQAMLHEPELLILDEPTDGLDPVGRSQIRQLISRLKSEGRTVFLNSHILQEVELISDRVAILAKGQVRGVGTPAELTARFHGALASTVKLHLACEDPNALTELEPGYEAALVRMPDNTTQFSCRVESQAKVDQLVDDLRMRNVSILRLERNQVSLEEVFMSAVGSQDSSVSDNETANASLD